MAQVHLARETKRIYYFCLLDKMGPVPSFLLVFAQSAEVRPGGAAAILQQASNLRLDAREQCPLGSPVTSLSASHGRPPSRLPVMLDNNF